VNSNQLSNQTKLIVSSFLEKISIFFSKKLLICIFSLLIFHFSLSIAVAHDFHTSITRLEYNAKEKTFEVSIRLFTDDFEKALSRANNGQKIVVRNNDKNDGIVERYVRQYFALISPQKQKKTYTYIGKEQEGDATWIYIEIPVKEGIMGYAVQNALLIDTFADQTNLVNASYLTQKKSYLCKKDEVAHLLEF
jgi:hypothetical protein